MKVLWTLLTVIASFCPSVAQDIKVDITGEWTTKGSADLLEKNDTIVFHQDIKFAYKNHLCSTLDITFSGKEKVIISDVTHCTEPGTVRTYSAANRYRISSKESKKVLTIIVDKKQLKYLVVKFEIQDNDSYPFETKTMKIVKI